MAGEQDFFQPGQKEKEAEADQDDQLDESFFLKTLCRVEHRSFRGRIRMRALVGHFVHARGVIAWEQFS